MQITLTDKELGDVIQLLSEATHPTRPWSTITSVIAALQNRIEAAKKQERSEEEMPSNNSKEGGNNDAR